MKQTLIQSAQQAARPLDVGGFQITVLASTEQTGGYELFRIAGPEGTGPGPHRRPINKTGCSFESANLRTLRERENFTVTALKPYPGMRRQNAQHQRGRQIFRSDWRQRITLPDSLEQSQPVALYATQ